LGSFGFFARELAAGAAQRSGEARDSIEHPLRLRQQVRFLPHDSPNSPGFLLLLGSFGVSVSIGLHGAGSARTGQQQFY
jgi:hypothetical protein